MENKNMYRLTRDKFMMKKAGEIVVLDFPARSDLEALNKVCVYSGCNYIDANDRDFTQHGFVMPDFDTTVAHMTEYNGKCDFILKVENLTNGKVIFDGDATKWEDWKSKQQNRIKTQM